MWVLNQLYLMYAYFPLFLIQFLEPTLASIPTTNH
jgi:hypothetical protein